MQTNRLRMSRSLRRVEKEVMALLPRLPGLLSLSFPSNIYRLEHIAVTETRWRRRAQKRHKVTSNRENAGSWQLHADTAPVPAYLIDPMHAPEPSAETGPGAHFTSTFSGTNDNTTPPDTSLGSKNPFRENASPTSPSSKAAKASTHGRVSSREAFPSYRADAFSDYANVPRRSSSGAKPPPAYEDATAGASGTRGRRRTSSLKERYPGDNSGEPLSIIRKESKKAARSPHLRKQNLPGPDLVDRLDPAIGGVPYHHEGPYDAASLARNRDPAIAPVNALQESNAEALKATPQENVRDAIEKHKPLDGVAYVPPGVPDRFGRTYEYEEGDDMMRERGEDEGYKRWAGKVCCQGS